MVMVLALYSLGRMSAATIEPPMIAAIRFITYVRFGAYAGLLDIPVEKIDALIIEVQPATVSVSNEDINTVTERDAKRAEIVRKALD